MNDKAKLIFVFFNKISLFRVLKTPRDNKIVHIIEVFISQIELI